MKGDTGDTGDEGGAAPLTPAWLGEVVVQSPEAIVVVDAAFVIAYVNDAASTLLRAPAAELVGSSALEFVHADDLVRVASNIDAVTHGVQPRAGMMQLQVRDGSVIDCDILPMHLTLPGAPDGPGNLNAVVVRDTALPDAHWRFLTSLSSGQTFERSIAVLADGVSGSVDGPFSVAFDDEGGRRVVGPVPEELAGVTPAGLVDDTPGTPWADAIATGAPVVRPVAELSPAIRARAEAIGAEVCIVVPVPDPGHGTPALIVQWAPDGRMGAVLREAIRRRPYDSVKLALERRYAQERLVHLALHDDLTGLANRARFFDVLGELRDRGAPYGVCYLDLDGFKPINDTFGHRRGDEALAACATRLRAAARDDDLVARLGGDEFAVACPGVDDHDTLVAIAHRLIDAIATGHPGGDDPGPDLRLRASAGCALGPAGADPDTVVGAADIALYEAKRSGGGTVQVGLVSDDPSTPA